METMNNELKALIRRLAKAKGITAQDAARDISIAAHEMRGAILMDEIKTLVPGLTELRWRVEHEVDKHGMFLMIDGVTIVRGERVQTLSIYPESFRDYCDNFSAQDVEIEECGDDEGATRRAWAKEGIADIERAYGLIREFAWLDIGDMSEEGERVTSFVPASVLSGTATSLQEGAA